ncbi:MAG: conserved membrane protein of unknown function [Promethearchaeota archaeon]|nr:MAG: conserved membrane protein of unknown function [Candidatus Lokiarchaeota archaeon]
MNENNQPTEKRIKQRNLVDKLIDSPVEFLIRMDISPNMLSFLGIVSIIIGSVFIYLNFIHGCIFLAWIPPAFIFLAGVFDVFDGEVARRTNRAGLEGAYLDSNVDRISDAIILLGLIYSNFLDYIWGSLILFLSLMISYSRSRAEALEVNMKGVGIMERAERLILLIIGLSIEIWVYKISYWISGTPLSIFKTYFIPIFSFLLIFTVAQRFYHTYKILSQND